MATLAPSRAKTQRDLLADAAGGAGDDGDLSLSFMIGLLFGGEVVVDDRAQVQGEVAQDVGGGKHLQHRQGGDRCQRVVEQLQRRRPCPGAVDGDVAAPVAHDLADARRAVDVRNDLQQEARRLHRFAGLVVRQRPVLVAHRGDGDRHRAEPQHAAQRVLLDLEDGRSQLLREAPQLAPAGNRRVAVQVHRVDVAALLAAEAHRDHLPAFGVVAEASRVGHADEFVLDDRRP